MKSIFLGFIVTCALFCADTSDIFFGVVDRAAVRGKRVSISGFVNATGCEASPCKMTAYRWFGDAKVIFILNFPDRFAPFVKRKRVLDPIRVNCEMVSDFEYSACYF
jgi:hypothetical protein